MSKFLLSVLIVLTFSLSAGAQGFSLGPKFGANIGKIDGAGYSDKFTLGYHAGGFMDIRFGKKKKWGIGLEVLWNQISTDTVTGFSSIYENLGDQNFQNPQLNYMSIPMMIHYRPAKLISFHTGAQVGLLLDKSNTLLENGQNAFRKGDVSVVAGVQLHLWRLRAYGRYLHSVYKSNSEILGQASWQANGYQVGLGVSIF